jgi:hypothetical protein
MPSKLSEKILVPTGAKVDVRRAKEIGDITVRLVEERCDVNVGNNVQTCSVRTDRSATESREDGLYDPRAAVRKGF